MKATGIILGIAGVFVFDMAWAGIGVTVMKNSNNPEFVFIPDLPDGSCVKENKTMRCTIAKTTKIRWGAGFCQNNKKDLDELLSNSKISLRINGKKIASKNISTKYETYNRQRYSHCHTWLIELKNWTLKNHTLETYNGKSIMEKYVLVVKPGK